MENKVHKNIFTIDYSQLENRFDAQFYKNSFDYAGFIRLSKIADVKGGKRIPLGLDYETTETPFLYLRVVDINKDDEVNFNSLNCIGEDVFNILSRYEIYENDLAISIAGTIGKIILLKNIPKGKRIILTENCAKIILKEDAKVLPEYLQLILQTTIIQKQIELNYIQTTIPKLGLDRINNLWLPSLPHLTVQRDIIQKYHLAFNQKQQKESEANALLSSIDTYILTQLGISLPRKINCLENRIFTTNFSEITGRRIDPDYNSKYEFIVNQKANYDFVSFKNILVKPPQYGANEEAIEAKSSNDIRYIRITDIDELGYLKNKNWKTALNTDERYLLNKDDLLFARSGSVGRCYIHKQIEKEAIFAGYLIRFVIDMNKAIPDFVFHYCNSSIYKYWVSAIERPAVQSNINAEEYKSLPIPLPPLEKQNEILEHINDIHMQIKKLQSVATETLEIAKREVEELIIG